MWYLLAASAGAVLGWAVCSCCVAAKMADAAEQKNAQKQPSTVYDFEMHLNDQQLKMLLARINSYGYRLISISQNGDLFCVFFERSLNG